jgi:hypothetical protein
MYIPLTSTQTVRMDDCTDFTEIFTSCANRDVFILVNSLHRKIFSILNVQIRHP